MLHSMGLGTKSRLLIFIAALVLAACAAPSQPAPTQAVATAAPTSAPSEVPVVEAEQSLVLASTFDTGDLLEPHGYTSAHSAIEFIYEGLTMVDVEGKVQPALATSWDISDDGLEYTFSLRQGVLFHDGTPFTADIVKWNFDRLVGKEEHFYLALLRSMQDVQVVDPYTVKFTFSEPHWPYLVEFALPRPVKMKSPTSVDASGNPVAAIGTGAWKLDHYTKDQETMFVRFDDYWGQKPILQEVVWRVLPDATTRVAALEAGEVHLSYGGLGTSEGGIPYQTLRSYVDGSNPDIQVQIAPGAGTRYLRLNQTRPALTDVRVRQAVAMAIDRQSINDAVFLGIDELATGFFSPKSLYAESNAMAITHDPDAAKALLSDAGYTDGNGDGVVEKDGEALVVETVYNAQIPGAQNMAEIIQANLEEVGIGSTLSAAADSVSIQTALNEGRFDIALYNTWAMPYDPSAWIANLIGSPTIEGIDGADDFDDSVIDFLVTEDEAERGERMRAATQFLIEDGAVMIPLNYGADYVVYRAEVKGISLPPAVYFINRALTGITIEN